MSLLSLSTVLLLILPTTMTSQLLDLLHSPLSDAQCVARCLVLPTQSSQDQCYQVCKFRQKHPDTDLCRLPQLCVDLGCQVACHEDHEASQSLIDSFSRRGCELSWTVSSEEDSPFSNVVFVLAGRDQAGNMWSLIKGNLTEPTFQMTEEFGAKYHTVAIVAVSSQSVRDVLKVKVPKDLNCSAKSEGQKTIVSGIEDSDLIAVICLSLLVSCLLLLLSALLCCRRRSTDGSSLPHLEDQNDPNTKRGEDGDKKSDSQERTRASDNVYTAFPSHDISLEGEEEYSYISYDFKV